MPQRTKKDSKHNRPSGNTGSRWHNFHFSGKLISCSVIFGFLLILVGGILLAIGMDREEENKSDDYGDLQKKPPLVFVGPVIMGIGGFTVIIGVIMCLVETKVFRRRAGDSNPLINSEGGESASRDIEAINGGSDPTAIPSDSKHYKKHQHGKKSPRKTRNGKKSHSSNEASSSSSQSSEPISISGKGSRNFLNASDTFLTPPGSFTQDDLQMQGAKRDAVNQTSASLLKSYNSSGTYSTEFQTPSASFIDSASFPSSQDSNEVPTPQLPLNIPSNLIVKSLGNARHEFLTPQNSNADVLETLEKPREVKSKEEYSPVINRHAFLTPKNSADLLEDSPPNEEVLEHMRNTLNLPDTFVSKKSPDKVATMNIVADIHEPSKQHFSDMNNALVKPSTKHSKPQEEVVHSDIKVDVLIDAIDDEVKGNTQGNISNIKDDETGESSENIKSNQNMVSENAQSVREKVDKMSNLIEKDELKANGESARSFEFTSEDNLIANDPTSKKDLSSRIDGNLDSLKKGE
ncbi:uncharacterized protein LOC129959496 [Argiope bruennichi]|uniref:Uncharacterized protein n=1 Tax=Argiope bruennichi TaxID=94029 RepID=A0A8T0F1R0_ARGBR|nr:uncharacterized protein LOC129959496 [Argiope bruennichi]KAF8785047.1 hypothetical protein HNY73_010643 [Argiope bruennichi]